MIQAINGNPYYYEIEQPQGEVTQPSSNVAQNISYRGNPTFERTPDSDYYEGSKKGKGLKITLSILGLAALAFGGASFFKGKSINADAKFFEKIETGAKALWKDGSDWVKKLFTKKP